MIIMAVDKNFKEWKETNKDAEEEIKKMENTDLQRRFDYPNKKEKPVGSIF
jgi:hypothetical protein